MPDNIWQSWYFDLKRKLTASLEYEIGEPEDDQLPKVTIREVYNDCN